MTQALTTIMYHYVRELPLTRYPDIKGLLTSQFRAQIEYLKRNYTFVTIQDCIGALHNDVQLPQNACLLTFDDGYLDHFTDVFPVLDANQIQGCFFPPAQAILENKVLDVNKLHFILASVQGRIDSLLKDIYGALDYYRASYQLKTNKYYFSRLATKNQFDPAEIIFIKRLLQRELPEVLRGQITDELFQKYVTQDERAFSRELYMDLDQLRCLVNHGMHIGSHSYSHRWLDHLSETEQESEIEKSIQFLTQVGASTENWVMCYPYGAYDESLLGLLRKRGCALGFTTKFSQTRVSLENALTLERFDTNDFSQTA